MVKQREAEVMGAGLDHRENRQYGSKTVSNYTGSLFVSIRPLVWHSGGEKQQGHLAKG